jgi:conjugal transfer pilus assembly protein TraE
VRLARFLATWRGLTLENRFHRVVLLLLLATNLTTALALVNAERTVVLVPPVLEGPVEVARDSAAREVKEAWALYVAELLGNVSPGNAEFLERAIEPLLAPALRRAVAEVMAYQVGEIQRESVTLTYLPRNVLYEPETDKVFVTGSQTSAGPAGRPQVRVRTYELTLAFRHYRPVVTHLDVYPEEPRTLERLSARGAPPPEEHR